MQGQQFSAVLPNQQASPAETLGQMNQQVYLMRQREAAIRQQQQERKDKLLSEAFGKLNLKDHLTGTVYDNVVTKMLNEAMQNVASTLLNNPDVSSASILMDVAKAVSDISQYSVKAKNVRANTEARVKEYAKDKSVDEGKLLSEALGNAFFEHDENGNTLSLKDPSKIDDQEDYVTPALSKAIKNTSSYEDALGGIKTWDYGDKVSETKGGVTKSFDLQGKYNPQIHDLVDDNGNVVDGQKAKATGVRIKSEPIKAGDMTAIGVPTSVYNRFSSNPVVMGALEQTPEYKQAFIDYPGIKPEDARRVAMYKTIPGYVPGYIKRNEGFNNSQLQNHIWIEDRRENGQQKPEVTWNNIYDVIDEKATANAKNNWYTRVNSLPPVAQEAVINWAKTMIGDSKENPVTQESIYITKAADGTLYLRDAKTRRELAPLPKVDVNLKVNTGQKPRAAVIKDAQQTTPTTQPTPTTGGSSWMNRAKKIK